MSTLRTQLDAARDEYRRARYPGDLLADLFPQRRPSFWQWTMGLAAITGLAAAIVLLLFLRQMVPTAPPPLPGPTAANVEPDGSDLSIVPEFPADISIVPSYQRFTPPALPSFPSLETADQADTSNAREAA